MSNLQLLSGRHNIMKWDCTPIELSLMAPKLLDGSFIA
jgi:hypothetical protein